MELKLLRENKKTEYLVVEIKYHLGGYNYGTGNVQPRGYYVSVMPKTIEGNTTMFGAFTGYRNCIHEVKRKSNKAYIEAVRKAKEEDSLLIQNMAKFTCIEQGFTEEADGLVKRIFEGIEKHYEVITNE